MLKSRHLAAGLCLAILASACAGGDERPPGPPLRGGGGDGGPRHAPNLFISPAGKPYRAAIDQPYPVAQWFAQADQNHDGHMSLQEFRDDAAAFFRELDVNHDGVVDGFEVQAYERTVAPEINPQIEGLRFGEGMDLNLGGEKSGATIGRSGGGRGGREQAGDRRPEGAGLFGLLNEPEPVAATDLQFNSHITLDEFLSAADRRFAALDRKNVGYLTLATLPKTPVQLLLERDAARRKKAGARRPGGRPGGPTDPGSAGEPPGGDDASGTSPRP